MLSPVFCYDDIVAYDRPDRKVCILGYNHSWITQSYQSEYSKGTPDGSIPITAVRGFLFGKMAIDRTHTK